VAYGGYNQKQIMDILKEGNTGVDNHGLRDIHGK